MQTIRLQTATVEFQRFRFGAQKIALHRRPRIGRTINYSLPLKIEQELANSLLIEWSTRKTWQNVSFGPFASTAYLKKHKTHYDNKDLFVICKRVAMRVNRRKMGS